MPLQQSTAYIAANDFPNSVLTDRAILEALFQTEGVLRPEDFAPVPGVGLAINVGPGFAAIEGKASLDQGFYFAWSDEDEDIAWVSPDSQPRIDTLILRVADAQYGTVSGSQGSYWEIITGAPAASPVARTDTEINTDYAVPGAWLPILDLRVEPGDTTFAAGDITDRRKIAQGITNAGTTAMRDRMDVSKLKKGFQFFNSTTGEMQIWDGDSWEISWSANSFRKFGAGGQRIYRQDYVGGTTDASGFMTSSHACPFTPTFVQVFSRAPGSSFAFCWGTDSYSATQWRGRWMHASSGGVYAGSTLAFTAVFWE